MAKHKRADIVSALDRIRDLPVDRRKEIEAGAAHILEQMPEASQLRTLERYVAGLGSELQLVARFPDGVSAEIPLRSGRPVKSRIKIEKSPIPE